MDRILAKLKEIKAEIEKLYSELNWNRDRQGSHQKILKIIALLNAAYPLAKYIDWRFQEDLLMNIREFEHRYHIEVSAMVYLKTCQSIIDRLINILEADRDFKDLIPTQKYYSKNMKFSVLKDLDTLFKTANDSIVYLDEHMDYVIVEALSDARAADITLVVPNPNSKFSLWVSEYNKEKTKSILLKTPKEKVLHDRYCILDGSELWQVSGSINAKNLNSITVQQIVDETSRKKIIEDIVSQI